MFVVVQSYESQLFGVPVNLDKSVDIGDQALCLQISVSELLPASDTKTVHKILAMRLLILTIIF
jgi:hypothetical protein